MEGIELPAALALLLASDLAGARQRERKRRLDVLMAGDLAADVADQPAQTRAQDAQFSAVTVELLGMGIAPRHHRRAFGDADVGLPQPQPVLVGEAVILGHRHIAPSVEKWRRQAPPRYAAFPIPDVTNFGR
jgi:hypothetical protein